ncbi:MAG: N-acetylmuramoyl-L-alanine amidase [Emergencia sp.]
MKIKSGIIMVLLLLVCLAATPAGDKAAETAAKLAAPMTLVIDAGHGGMDSGASSAQGVTEKDINLAIAKALGKEAEKYGIRVIMTREDEDGLYSQSGTGGKWSKVEDLQERKRIIEEADPDLVISIHLNSFISDTGVRGAQVFYAKGQSTEQTEEGKVLAEKIQDELNVKVNEGKDRIVLPKSDIYLFRDAKQPMILIECGFLSNPEDAAALQTEVHQKKTAECILAAVAENYGLKRVSTKKFRVISSRTENR